MDPNNNNKQNNFNYNMNNKVYNISGGGGGGGSGGVGGGGVPFNNGNNGKNSGSFSNVYNKKDETLFTKIQRYQFMDRMLNDNFPMAFTLILALLGFFTGAVLIGLQILCVIYRTPLFFVAVGLELKN